MRSAFVADLDKIEFPALATEGSTVFRIAADRLEIGMYVVDLDRPWSDTPFPPGGLYLADHTQAETLRRHCSSVLVDTHFSDNGRESAIRVAAHLFDGSTGGFRSPGDLRAYGETRARQGVLRSGAGGPVAPPVVAAPTRLAIPGTDTSFAETGAAAPGTSNARPRDDVRVSRAWRMRLRRLMVANDRGAGLAAQDYGLLERARSWISGHNRPVMPGAGSMAGLRTTYGSLVGATTHPNQVSITAAMPKARQVYAEVLEAHAASVSATRLGQPLPWSQIIEVMRTLADSVIEHPDAVLWCDRIHEQRSLGNRAPATQAVLMARFARHLGLSRDEMANLAAIGIVSELGKLRLPKGLLNYPGQLNPAQFEVVKTHVKESLDLLKPITGMPAQVLRGVAEHHERADGSGYPGRLKGASIGLHGACAAIVDSYTALTSARSYANPMSTEDALAALLGWTPALFDTGLTEQFALCMGLFPVGSTVELTGGGIAIVIDQSPDTGAASRVLVLTSPEGKPLSLARNVATSTSSPADPLAEKPVRIGRGLHVGALGIKPPDYYSLDIARPLR
jgi:HD-GYP domain-containing protein (c-di-GMP phosphodiesterase class II)